MTGSTASNLYAESAYGDAVPLPAAAKYVFVSNLYSQQATPLVKYLTARFRNAEEAKEIAQEAWLRFFRLPAPEELENAKAFLFQTASNLAIDRARRATLEQRYLDREAMEPQREESPSVEQSLQGCEELALIDHALTELPLKCRQAFVMHRVSGRSYPEIAKALAVSTSMVEKYIIQALKHFRKTLNRG
ncbi:MAG: sigma-70 family RNA polymerase sigma factor [Pseudomonadales bacterium]